MAKKAFKYGAIGLVVGPVCGVLLFGLGFFFVGAIFGAMIGAGIGYRADVHSDLLDRINAVRGMLGTALSDQDEAAEFKLIVKQWLKLKVEAGSKISAESIEIVFAVAVDYIRRTPDLMEALFRSAKSSNLEQEIIVLLRKTSLPQFEARTKSDKFGGGIAGFLEDAYAAQYLIEKAASWQGGTLARTIEGNIDLHAGNAFVAALLPRNLIEVLNNKVDAALNASQARQMLARMMQRSAAFQGSWNHASQGVDFKKEIVKDEIYHDLAQDGIFMRH